MLHFIETRVGPQRNWEVPNKDLRKRNEGEKISHKVKNCVDTQFLIFIELMWVFKRLRRFRRVT